MKQLIPFDPAKGGDTPGLCLKNTRLGYGIPALYNSAMEAWSNTEQHPNRNFPNLDTPIYFSYVATLNGTTANYGHIGVRLANGQFWSDGKTYASLEEYEKNHAPKFLGWGESVNKVKVIEGDNMQQDIDQLYKQVDNLNKQVAELYTALDNANKRIDQLEKGSSATGEFQTITVLTKKG